MGICRKTGKPDPEVAAFTEGAYPCFRCFVWHMDEPKVAFKDCRDNAWCHPTGHRHQPVTIEATRGARARAHAAFMHEDGRDD